MTATEGKVVVIGLELGDAPLLRRWAEAGDLPVLQTLLREGVWRSLETPATSLHIAGWPSVYTGASPGEHGVYYTHQPAPGLQGYARFHPGLYGRPTFWSLLDGAGVKCAVIDPPYAHPEEGYSGRFVYDWGSWAHYLQGGAVPADLWRRLNKAVGAYPLGLEAHDFGLAPLDAATAAQKLVSATAAKADATLWLMNDAPWDVLVTVFGETHVAGHYCWSESDLGPMRRAYQAIDAAIGRIVAAAGPESTIVVISADGVGPNRAGWHVLPQVLERLGFSTKPGAHTGEQAAGPRKFDPVKALRDLLPKDFRKQLARKLPTALRDRLAQRVDMADVDWSRTRAYCLPTDLEGCLRVNLVGREPQGIVQPGAAYEAVLDELEAECRALRDPATDAPLVSQVIRSDRVFAGPRRHYLPDLVVRWVGDQPVTAARSARAGTIEMPSPDPRPGTHSGKGFALVTGAGVNPRGFGEGHVADLAPSLLARFGVPVPQYMQGRNWPEVASA